MADCDSNSISNKENNSHSEVSLDKKRFFTTPVAKLNRSIVRGGGNRRNNSTKALSAANTSCSIMYKQSLRANNKNLAKALDISKLETAGLLKKVLELEQQKQDQTAKISVLRRLTDDSNEAVETEIKRRMQLWMERLKRKLESAVNQLDLVANGLHDVLVMCEYEHMKGVDEIVKDTLELTQMCATPDHFNANWSKRLPRAVYSEINAHSQSAELENRFDLASLQSSYDEDVESRLSIVNETAEMRRKSSLQRELRNSIDMTACKSDGDTGGTPLAPESTITRSKRRMLIGSQQLLISNDNTADADDSAEHLEISADTSAIQSVPPTRSKRRSKRQSMLNSKTSDLSTQPLETVFSAAAGSSSPARVVVLDADGLASPSESAERIPEETVPAETPGMSSEVPSDDIDTTHNKPPMADSALISEGTEQDLTSGSQMASALPPNIPYDEIPVPSIHAAKQAALEKARIAKEAKEEEHSRSRRQTRIIRHGSQPNNNLHAAALLNDASSKFFIQISPARFLGSQKSKQSKQSGSVTEDSAVDWRVNKAASAKAAADGELPATRRTSRRTYCVEDDPTQGVVDENDSILLCSDSVPSDSDDPDPYNPSLVSRPSLQSDLTAITAEPQAPDEPPVLESLTLEPATVEPADEQPLATDSHLPATATATAANPEPLSRQMEIQCKGGQIKVVVGSRDGGPVSGKTKQKKKKKKAEQLPDTMKKSASQPRDPFDLSLSETVVDLPATLKEFTDRQKTTEPMNTATDCGDGESVTSQSKEKLKQKTKRSRQRDKQQLAPEDNDDNVTDKKKPRKTKRRQRSDQGDSSPAGSDMSGKSQRSRSKHLGKEHRATSAAAGEASAQIAGRRAKKRTAESTKHMMSSSGENEATDKLRGKNTNKNEKQAVLTEESDIGGSGREENRQYRNKIMSLQVQRLSSAGEDSDTESVHSSVSAPIYKGLTACKARQVRYEKLKSDSDSSTSDSTKPKKKQAARHRNQRVESAGDSDAESVCSNVSSSNRRRTTARKTRQVKYNELNSENDSSISDSAKREKKRATRQKNPRVQSAGDSDAESVCSNVSSSNRRRTTARKTRQVKYNERNSDSDSSTSDSAKRKKKQATRHKNQRVESAGDSDVESICSNIVESKRRQTTTGKSQGKTRNTGPSQGQEEVSDVETVRSQPSKPTRRGAAARRHRKPVSNSDAETIMSSDSNDKRKKDKPAPKLKTMSVLDVEVKSSPQLANSNSSSGNTKPSSPSAGTKSAGQGYHDIGALLLELSSEEDDATPVQVSKRRRRINMLISPVLTPGSGGGAEELNDRTLTPGGAEEASLPSVPPASQRSKQEAEKRSSAQTEQMSPPRKSRRAAASLNFKEPSLGGKLRRGDPGTSTLYKEETKAKNKNKKKKKT